MWSICSEIRETATESDNCALQGDSFDVGNEYNTFLIELIPELLKSLDDLHFSYDGVNNRKSMFNAPITANEDDQTNFLLHNLQPNSLYFLQVQALVQFGNERLKGDKSGYILNTTSYNNFTNNDVVPLNLSTRSKKRGLYLEKIFWSQDELKARITWKPKKSTQQYTVRWWMDSCNENYNGRNHKKAATIKGYRFDLYDLKFNCRYRVSVRNISSNGSQSSGDTILTFSTPSCKSFKSLYEKAKCTNIK
ncbi:hypothetical protein HHI36_013688 [Cryptolaemus montrouzieri]|uniref:Uncharacterized protein n=1 Tax=Cryptolaemus montrouzieri TaxID=559131 RepID=A0ABD2NHY5_9CUCU